MAMIESIVVGVDGSDLSLAAVKWASELAEQVGARLTVVHAFEPLALLGKVKPPVDFPALKKEAQERLRDEWCAAPTELGVDHDCRLVEDRPAHALVAVAEEVDADLVVAGTRGQGGVKGLVMGSVAMELPHIAPCAVVIIPPLDDA
jgi:nucleotide-binding universal stress UspA family protein